MEKPWYIKHWEESYNKPKTSFYDKDAEDFYHDFFPMYLKYVGSRKLLQGIREYINTHEIKRKDDFRLQVICMWCDHIHYYRDLHNIPFKAEDIFSIRIPKEILSVQ